MAQKGYNSEKNQFEHPLHEYEDFVFDKLPKMMRKNPEDVRFSTLAQASEHISDYSDERIDYIKTCFSKIINNVVNFRTKLMHA
mmetsp:Transcript_7720/g.6833  ORF Transcript_7720/g.6833 Transcript_7720/m.6833 type:complete len:84 (+) Transcript_7720:212-463(+)